MGWRGEAGRQGDQAAAQAAGNETAVMATERRGEDRGGAGNRQPILASCSRMVVSKVSNSIATME